MVSSFVNKNTHLFVHSCACRYQSLAEEGFELPDEQDVRDAQTKENAQQPLGDGDTPTTENADSAK